MPELPTCTCVRGLPPYDRLTAIYQAAAELSGDGDLPDPVCVAGIPPFSRFSYIYEAFRVFAGEESLPSQICVAGESPQDQVSRIYQAVAVYADDASLQSYECVRGMPIWQQWIEIYRALYLAAGSPAELVNPACVSIANLDVLSDVFCALVGSGGNATLLASFYIPEIVDTFAREIAAGYTGVADVDTFQREAAIDVLRDAHYQSGEGPYVILEDTPTECVLVAPENVAAVGAADLEFDAVWDAIPVTDSLLRYEWRLDGTGGWTSNGTSLTLTGEAATAGSHVLNVRAVSTSGVFGDVATSPMFEVEGGGSLTVNLIAYWNLDEVSGTRVDPVNGNDLTSINAAGSATGIISLGASLNRSLSQALVITSNPDMEVSDIDFSIGVWVNLSTLDGSNRALVAKSTNTDASYFLYLDGATSRFKFAVYSAAGFSGGSNVDATTFGAVSTGVWCYVLAWHDSVLNTINIQVNDGGVDSAAHTTGVYNATAADFMLGSDSFPGDYFDGIIDEVGFWKRTLSSGERSELYNSGAGNTYPF